MAKQKIVAMTVVVLLIGISGYFLYQYRSDIEKQQQPVACTAEAKLCPDGSSVGRTGPNCEFSVCPGTIIYATQEFGFELTLPESWRGYTVEKKNWQGWVIDTGEQKYSGVELIIKNPQTNVNQKWQDIPIMVFTPDIWKLVEEEKVSVSAAPISPAKIGENTKYVFATPPRWYGFTDAIGWQEAVDIVKTFKELNFKQ